MKRISRGRRLTPKEAAKYKAVRAQFAEELPDLVARHQSRMAALDQIANVPGQLKAARGQKPEVNGHDDVPPGRALG
jgi:hypothetical protein